MGPLHPKISKVVAADLGDILEISQYVWEGHDYLPYSIRSWLADPAAFTFGIRVRNLLVALANLRVIEGGRTGWMEGLRVHPDYRGRGFADALTEHVIRKAKDLRVQRLRYTTSVENVASLRLAAKFGFSRLLVMDVFRCSTPSTISQDGTWRVARSNPVAVHSLLKGPPPLAPANVLIYDWKALDNSLRNLRALASNHAFYVTTRAEGRSVSFGGARSQKEGSVWAFTIYADELRGFLQQLRHNIRLSIEGGFRALMGTCAPLFGELSVRSGLLSGEYWATSLILVERSLLHR